MRYLRQQNINRRAPYDQRLYVDMTDSIVMTTTNNMLMPVGTTAQRPVSPVNGMIRYNTNIVTGGEVEVYQNGYWRSLRFKESTQINKQSFTGDGVESVFGPLLPQPPTLVQSGTTWSGDNLIVIVGGVYQIFNSNYLIQTGTTLGTVNGTDYSVGSDASKYYIHFTSASPGGSTPITILSGFDQ